ncbi:SCO0930 family lipoprotein [Actinophytocola sp.]|uniref:SCO0930 family lipoprotein n=1 Tax=Actinophytocola sp. TaxID=1872138 RepID=UPI0025C42CCE|nr:SCO0930 family lipoprotein [Actinophytocola sp.]
MAAAAIGLVTLSACTCGPQSPTDTYAPPPTKVAAAGVQQAADVTLSAVEVDGLGQILTDQDGYPLYRFTMDSAEPPRSNCDTACAAKWPPLTSEVDIEVSGVDRSLIGTVTRDDGTNQVTVNGWPVYKFADDAAPGEVNGQGVNGTWFAVTPDGGKAGAQPEQSGPVQVVAAELPGFGPALTDQDGQTLYLFTKDSKAPSKSVCNGACAEKWPPVIDDGNVQVTGLDKAIIGSVTRDDGTEQVTVGGWPVYRYEGDTDAGQTNGHGVAGTWFVIEPAGCKSAAPVQPREAPAEAPADTAPDTEPDTDTGTGY